MKNNLIIHYLIVFISMAQFVWASEFKEYDRTKRPPEVQKLIDKRFDDLSSKDCSQWSLRNGSKKYGLFDMDEQLLFKDMILSSPFQEKFIFKDDGCGGGQCGYAMSEFLDNDPDLAQRDRDFEVIIINARAEQCSADKIVQTKKCTIHNFGRCKIENLTQSLHDRDLFKNGETLDLGVSSFCYRHLMDGFAPVVDTYNLLGKGRIMLFDDFNVSVASPGNKHSADGNGPASNCFIIKTLLDMNIPFLMKKYGCERCDDHFMIQKLTNNIQGFPYSFGGVHDTGSYEHSSRYYLRFNAKSNGSNINEITDSYNKFHTSYYAGGDLLYGNQEVFDYLGTLRAGVKDRPIQYFGPAISDKTSEKNEEEVRPTNAVATAPQLAALDDVWNKQ